MATAETDPKSIAIQASLLVVEFLEENSPEYRKLALLRRKGWADPRGDAFFEDRRQKADSATPKTAKFFYKMMQYITWEMNSATHALEIPEDEASPPQVLDFCAAPGGFLHTLMCLNPTAYTQAFSLPISEGGHRMLMPKNKSSSIEFLDITMLAEDMGAMDLPTNHPDAGHFKNRRLQDNRKFDLILCDGQVLRGHRRAQYRERFETRRLAAVQLALGLKHIKSGGTMIILLHRLDAWESVATLYRFSKFSSIKTFKPRRAHAARSSFYLIAQNIQREHSDAIAARKLWDSAWKTATLSLEDEYLSHPVLEGLDAGRVLEDFGKDLVKLGKFIWVTQAKALAKTPFLRTIENESGS